MQIVPSPDPAEAGAPRPQDVKAGHHVRVRGARWRIVEVRAYDDCQVVTLCGLTPPLVGVERRVLSPFDAIEPVQRRRRARFVRNVLWRRACRAAIAADAPPGALRADRANGVAVETISVALPRSFV